MNDSTTDTAREYQSLALKVTEIAQKAGDRIRELYSPQARVSDRESLMDSYQRVEAVAADGVREVLSALRPDAQWLDDDPESHRAIQERNGEWWIVDGVEGAVNFIHGVDEFSINITLIRDNRPVLAVVHRPITDLTYTAVHGGGAHLNGCPLAVSDKTDLKLAIVATSQAGGTAELNHRTAQTIETMLNHVLVVRQTVPSTFPLPPSRISESILS